MANIQWMRHGFIAAVVVLLGMLAYVSIFVERHPQACPSATVPQSNSDNLWYKTNDVRGHMNTPNPIKHELQVVANQLRKAVSMSISRDEMRGHVRTSLNLLLEMMERLGVAPPDVSGNVAGTQTVNTGKGKSLDVCPEVYRGKKADHPLYQKNWALKNCSDARPFSNVLSILLSGFDYVTDDEIFVVLREIHASYPKLTVHVAVRKTLTIPSDLTLTIHQHVLDASAPANVIWNTLAEKATTEFVLVGRRIERFLWHANLELERLVRVLSELAVDVAGGAFRTPDGHWSLGCQQTHMAHYKLKYIDGYYGSSKSCAFCDYIPSSFVSRVSTLRAIKFNMASPEVMFRDYFMRLNKQRKLTVSCPDVMFYMQGNNESEAIKRKEWVPVARAHALNVIHFAGGKQLSFTCEEAATTCKWRKGISNPICCLNHLTNSIHDTFDFCDKLGIFCRANCGTTLGAIKFNGVLPWELDGDVSYTPSNKTNFWNRKQELISRGYSVAKQYPGQCRQFDQKNDKCRKFAFRAHGWKIDIWDNTPDSVTGWLREHHLQPTKIKIGDRWVDSLTNPGLYSRNFFIYEVLKHVEHAYMVGKSSKIGGHYLKCPKPGFHACLDQAEPDGNIDIMYN